MRKIFVGLSLMFAVAYASAQMKPYKDVRLDSVETSIDTLQAYQTSSGTRLDANDADIDRLENDVLANAFRTSVNYDLTVYDMNEGFSDVYADQTGIDLSDGSNYVYDATGDYYRYHDEVEYTQPVMQLKMNDSNATTVVTDSGLNGIDGVANRNTSLTSTGGLVNAGYALATTSDYITNAYLNVDWGNNFDVQDITMVWMMKMADWDGGTDGALIYQSVASAEPTLYAPFILGDGTFRFWMQDDASEEVGSTTGRNFGSWANNSWHQIGWTWDATAKIWTLYTDGVVLQAYTNTNMGTVSGHTKPLWIGNSSYHGGTTFSAGDDGITLDDFRIYEKVLTPNEMASLYNNALGTEESIAVPQTFSHFILNDSNATTVVVNNGTVATNGVLTGGDNTADISVSGKINSALDFDGTNDYVVASTFDFSSHTESTLMCWVNMDITASAWVFGVTDKDSSANRNLIKIGTRTEATGRIEVALVNGSTTRWNATIENADWVGSWVHVALKGGVNGLTLYINGSQNTASWNWAIGTSASTYWLSDFSAPADALCIGGEVYGGTSMRVPFNGKVDDARYYGTGLTDNQIAEIYNQGSGMESELDAQGTGGNMELISTNGYTATTTPTESRVLILHEDVVGTATINTDVKAWSSSDDGSTWDQVTLSDIGELSSGINMLSGTNALTGASTNMRYRVTTHSSTNQGRIHGSSLLWK